MKLTVGRKGMKRDGGDLFPSDECLMDDNRMTRACDGCMCRCIFDSISVLSPFLPFFVSRGWGSRPWEGYSLSLSCIFSHSLFV